MNTEWVRDRSESGTERLGPGDLLHHDRALSARQTYSLVGNEAHQVDAPPSIRPLPRVSCVLFSGFTQAYRDKYDVVCHSFDGTLPTIVM